MIVEDGLQKAWWCGHNAGGDGVYYSEGPVAEDTWSKPKLVLAADVPWEVTHACDPSVIRGDFTVDGDDWSYLMYYGAADLSSQNTKLGMAFSNNGTEWKKYGDAPLLVEPGMQYDYGVGMPGLFTVDGKPHVAYFDTGRNSAMLIREVNADGTLAERIDMLPMSGGDTFADLAFSEAEGRWYVATKSQLPPTVTPPPTSTVPSAATCSPPSGTTWVRSAST
ncbi:hypothetical protein G7085_06400 [Tessaracoccus sp. HDW20]|uniref:hypothetical protein n=1 Tax=Tessaracoccus coleopterorum TaxID=2714950 RepID=UPI0018D4B7C5|nr:hypothetical protein [Tessaracoccus coleopterorum]NHB84358.1 hypothetical protein [Tessaracoccus coleopterorum]